MILESYKVICDECKWELKEFPYKPEEPDLRAYKIIVYKGKTFCCTECLKNYKKHEYKKP